MIVNYTGFVENDNSERVQFAVEVNQDLSGGNETALIQALKDYGASVVGTALYCGFQKHVDTVTDVTPS